VGEEFQRDDRQNRGAANYCLPGLTPVLGARNCSGSGETNRTAQAESLQRLLFRPVLQRPC
jgi:hypothetical protein